MRFASRVLYIFFLMIMPFVSCNSPQADKTSGQIVPAAATVKLFSENMNFSFVEGPAWDGSDFLYFTDIPNNRIHKYSYSTKQYSVFRENSNGANGLIFDHSGRLVACEGRAGRVTAMDQAGKVVAILAEEYKSKRFNAPNDLVIDAQGGIYFTDPDFGSQGELPQAKNAVYYRSPDGKIIRVIDNLDEPNGIILSPDGSLLYVVDTASPIIHSYKISQNGVPVDNRIFAELKLPEGAENDWSGADGLAIDQQGNLYVTSLVGIQIFNSNGDYIDTIKVPEVPANCTFGGPEMKTLFITARRNLYAIDLNTVGVRFPL